MQININEKFVTILASKFEEMEKMCNEKEDITVTIQLVKKSQICYDWDDGISSVETLYSNTNVFGLKDTIIYEKIIDTGLIINTAISEINDHIKQKVEIIKKKYQNLSLWDRIFNWKNVK